MRADAQQNREHILQAAHDAFAESDVASLNSIAKRAGVGPGTLYRHFPTREALILAVYRHDVQLLVDSVTGVLARHEPLEAFRVWFERLASYVRIKHGLGEALTSAAAQKVVNETYEPMTKAVRVMIDAREAAEVLLLLMGFLWRVEPGDNGEAQATRLFDPVIDGLRPPA
jgi:AcrR family transcriptional regulator